MRQADATCRSISLKRGSRCNGHEPPPASLILSIILGELNTYLQDDFDGRQVELGVSERRDLSRGSTMSVIGFSGSPTSPSARRVNASRSTATPSVLSDGKSFLF